jgi:ATP-dependent helicase/nuclease subunit A
VPLNKAYDLFSMMDGVDKHLAVIEDERRLMGRVLEYLKHHRQL